MGVNLTTTITTPQVVAVGGQVTGPVVVTPPSAGNFYLLMEQYTSALVFIPGSRAYLQLSGTAYINNTTSLTTFVVAVGGVSQTVTVLVTVPNSDCLLYLFLKQRPADVIAGAFVVGITYQIITIGTTDFTLIGATANTVGLTFTATGVGAGTGTGRVPADPNTDTTIDYVSITLQSSTPSTGFDIGEIMPIMITMMIVVMMMKMMVGTTVGKKVTTALARR